jgi:hypothetical protein
MSCNKPCEGCALVKGTTANSEPYNALKAQICLLGGLPFYCHHDEERQNLDANEPSRRVEVRAMRICASWKRDTAELARAGYFKTDNAVKRVYAQIALGALETFVNTDSSQIDKKTARRTLRGCLEWLIEARAKCN